MSLFNKLRLGNGPEIRRARPRSGSRHMLLATMVAKGRHPPPATGVAPRSGRLSNGLKEFLWQLDGIGRGHLLDLGPARQTTITFFIERGFKVYTEDLLTTWKDFLDADEQRKKELPPDADRSAMTPAARAERFLENHAALSGRDLRRRAHVGHAGLSGQRTDDQAGGADDIRWFAMAELSSRCFTPASRKRFIATGFWTPRIWN